jgi:transcriptional regulator GlxA family with amidase domain
MQVQVLVLDGVFDTGLSVVLDTFQTATELAAQSGKPSVRFDVQLVGLGRHATTQQKLRARLTPATEAGRPDVVVVPALGAKMPDALSRALACSDVERACRLLGGWADAGCSIASACTGTFVVARAGLLDGHSATTTWWLSPLFRQLYPRVELDDSRMLVKSARYVTAGAALAHLDLALFLIRSKSPALATLTARYLVVEQHASQAAFAIPDHLAHSDPLVERFERWARRHLGERFSLEAAAHAAGTSERTLARRLKLTLGKSPLGYVQELRVERAVHLLQTTAESVDAIAAKVGYEDGITLRNLLRRRTGRGVRELRSPR